RTARIGGSRSASTAGSHRAVVRRDDALVVAGAGLGEGRATGDARADGASAGLVDAHLAARAALVGPRAAFAGDACARLRLAHLGERVAAVGCELTRPTG